MEKIRKFSIPFNRTDVSTYMSIISNYNKNQIENIYFSLPEIDKHLYTEDENDISKEFLQKSLDYKRIVTYNAGIYNYSDDELRSHCDKVIFPLVEKHRIDGFIITNLNLSKYIKQNFPNIEIHLSCNNPVYTLRQAKTWIKEGQVDIINPPRESGRMVKFLKELHDNNIKIKVLLNNGCTFSCPYQMNHTCYNGLDLPLEGINCSFDNLLYGINSNVIIPRWMTILDDYVDIYKIAGRRILDMNCLKHIFDIYINNEPAEYLYELNPGCATNILYRNGVKLKLSDIPDKLLACEAKKCESCNVCKKILKKYTN